MVIIIIITQVITNPLTPQPPQCILSITIPITIRVIIIRNQE